MSTVPTEDLVLLALAESGGTVPEVAESTGVDALGDHLDLVATLEQLGADGAVARVESDSGDRPRFRLTAEGRDRVAAARRRSEELSVEVVDDRRRRCTLSEAADHLDRPLVEVAAELTEDGVYHAGDPPSDPFVDREDALRRCRERLDAAPEGRPEVILVEGAPGVGKTTLADRLVDGADDWECLRTGGRTAGSTPYGPLRDLLSAAGADPDEPFEDAPPAAGDPEAVAAQRRSLFASVLDRLRPSGGGPRLLVVDDLHLADPGTRSFLRYLVEDPPDRPLAVLACARPDELPEDADVPDGEAVTRVELDRFGREETGALVERVVGHRGAPDSLVEVVHERTGGNPLFVVETVSLLLETDQLHPRYEWYPESPGDVDVPNAVRAAIDDRIAGFDRPARDLLYWAGTVGRRVEVDVLRAVTDLDDATLEAYLDAFLDAGLFEAVDADRTAVTFHSGVVREALVEDLDDEQRRRRHEAVARTLADRAADPAAVAHQFRRAGRPERAVEFYERAGRRATGVYAHDTALDHLHRALDVAREHDRRDRLVDLATTVASVHETVGEYDEASRYAQFARDRAETPVETGQAVVRLAAAATGRGDHERAIELADAGLEAVAGADPGDLECRLLDRKATARRQLGRYDGARETASRQRELAADLGDSPALARAVSTLGLVAQQQGDHDEARERFEEALDRYREVDDRHGVAESRNRLGLVAKELGDFEAARRHHEAAMDAYEEVGDRHGVAKSLVNLGLAAFRRNDYDAASDHLAAARDRYREVGNAHGVAKALNNLGMVSIRRGRQDRAREYYRDALDRFEAVGDRHGVAKASNNLGGLAQQAGDLDAAESHLSAALEAFRDVGDRHGTARCLINLGLLDKRHGDLETARERTERSLELFREVGDRHTAAVALNNLGELLSIEGEYDAAVDRYEDALELYRETGNRHDAATTLSNLGGVARTRGEFDRARERFEAALETYRDLDDRDGVAATRAHLGVVAHERGREGTAREHLEAAAETAREAGSPAVLAAALARLGRLEFEAGDDERAVDAGGEAVDAIAEAPTVDTEGPDPTEQLRGLVEAAVDAGHPGPAEEWCRRGADALEDGEWFRDRRSRIADADRG